MDYIQDDPYSHHQHESPYHPAPSMPYGTVNYSAAENTYDRDQSPHSSHQSLQSDSYRYNTRNVPKTLNPDYESGMRNSMSSPRGQEQNGNYSTYTSIGRTASPHGSITPTRDASYPGSRNSYQALSDHGAAPVHAGPHNDYGDYSDHPPSQSPYTEDRYRDSPVNDPHIRAGDIDRQNYDDRPDLNGPDDPYYNGPGRPPYPEEDNHSDGYPGERNSYQDAPYDPYSNHDDINQPRERNSYQTQEEPYVTNPRYADTDLDGPNYRGSYAKQEDPYNYSENPRVRESYSSNRPDDPYQHPENFSAGPPEDDLDASKGLPPVRADPFADDPFHDGVGSEASYNRGLRPQDEDPYYRGPSPRIENIHASGPAVYEENLPPYEEEQPYNTSQHDPTPYNENDLPHYNDYMDHPDDYPHDNEPYHPEMREEVNRLQAPPNDYNYSDGRRTPSDSGRPGFPKWRNPDLQEVIDYLLDEDDDVKAHAAAYLQHLCFMDDDMKAKTRGLDGIRPLVKLLSNDFPEVHRNACGALQNLSYGKANNENKKAIRNHNGIPELVRLLRKTQDEDVKESVTGILWNLSSCEDLKKPVIDDGIAVLVNVVIIPGSGFDRMGSTPYRDHEPWTTVFRNGTGVIRNVSSAGYEARRKLRECRGLVNALIHTLKQAADSLDLDNKPVENVVCTIRNLSYRIQEVQDPDFYKKRYNTLQRMERAGDKGENSGCFGGGAGKKKGQQRKGDNKNSPHSGVNSSTPQLPTSAHEYKALWGNEVIQKYLILIKNTSNPITLEAGAGAIQNLVACDWAPAVEIRANVRKEKGLPHLVDLLAFENDRVVCAAATALRNLAIDERNKELVGKYAMKQLVSKLPQDTRHSEIVPPDDTLCAVIATMYEVVKNNQDFAQSLLTEKGVPRLMSITMSEGKYLARTIKYASTVLRTMWQFKALHSEYSRLGHKESNFLSASAFPRPEGKGYQSSLNTLRSPPNSNHTTPYNTLSRPISAQGYDDNTLSRGPMHKRAPPNNNSFNNDGYHSMGNSNSALHRGMDSHDHPSRMGRPDDIPMSDLGPSPGYAPLDEPRQKTKPPIGGVPLFPNLPPNSSPDDGRNVYNTNPEPLYAQVNKGNRRHQDDYSHSNELILESGGGGAGGADSWV